MEHILNIINEIDKLSDEKLLKNFQKDKPLYGRMRYYAVFAKRIKKFKDLLFSEIISEKNTIVKLRTFKPSWIIAISILDYCEDEDVLKELALHIKKHWTKDDYESFVHYISKEERFKKYF